VGKSTSGKENIFGGVCAVKFALKSTNFSEQNTEHAPGAAMSLSAQEKRRSIA
jgi:hypothetical protein